MSVFGNQVAVRVATIPLESTLSPETDLMKLYVQALAHRYQPEVFVLHVVEPGSTSGTRDQDLPVKIYRVFEESQVQDLTRNGASTPHPNIFVIGTRGAEDLSGMVLGSTAQEFLHKAGIPVLTIGPRVPLPDQPFRMQSIVCATDYSPEAAKACVSAFPFMQDLGAQVYVCQVLPDFESEYDLGEEDIHDRFIGALEALVPEVPTEWADPECVLDYKYAADGILSLAQRVKASLIVLGTRKALRGNDSIAGLTFQVISDSKCPVLTIQR